jgi:hypothetical protein
MVVKLNGSEKFDTEYYDDPVYIYDGYQYQKRVLNYISGSRFSNVSNQISSDQIMEIVFRT